MGPASHPPRSGLVLRRLRQISHELVVGEQFNITGNLVFSRANAASVLRQKHGRFRTLLTFICPGLANASVVSDDLLIHLDDVSRVLHLPVFAVGHVGDLFQHGSSASVPMV
jgi:hypothetical protein